MTIRLYDQDARLLDFTATVRACRQTDGGYRVALDRTAFFPEGGGQGADHGTLGGVRVLDVHDADGEVWHWTDGPLEAGMQVQGHVDGARRLSMMQQHSGEHIFSGLVHKLYGYDNVGFHIGSEAVTMDFNGPLSQEDVQRVETLANEAVWANLPVQITHPSPQEREHMAYRSKKALTGDVRIVQIPGVDTCACCGTHVGQTGSVGQIKVIGMQKYKSGVRISILCGVRALAQENAVQRQVHRAAVALSARQEEVADAVDRLLAERDALRARCDALGMQVFSLRAGQEEGRSIRVVACAALPASQARKAAGQLCIGARMGLVLVPREEGWSFACSSQTEDVRPATRALCEAFGGRGGGPRDMTQGVLGKADVEAIRVVLEKA